MKDDLVRGIKYKFLQPFVSHLLDLYSFYCPPLDFLACPYLLWRPVFELGDGTPAKAEWKNRFLQLQCNTSVQTSHYHFYSSKNCWLRFTLWSTITLWSFYAELLPCQLQSWLFLLSIVLLTYLVLVEFGTYTINLHISVVRDLYKSLTRLTCIVFISNPSLLMHRAALKE